MNLAQEEDVSRRLAGHWVVKVVEEEHDGFSDAGRKDQVKCLGEIMYRLFNVLFSSKPLCNGPQKDVWHADHKIDACL